MSSYRLEIWPLHTISAGVELEIGAEATLADLHEAIASAFGLDPNLAYRFWMDDLPDEGAEGYGGGGSGGSGAPLEAEEAVLEELDLPGMPSFLYCHDPSREHWHEVFLLGEGEMPGEEGIPRILARWGEEGWEDADLPAGEPPAGREDLVRRLAASIEDEAAAVSCDDRPLEELLESDLRLATDLIAWARPFPGRLIGVFLEAGEEAIPWMRGLIAAISEDGGPWEAVRLAGELAELFCPRDFLPEQAVCMAREPGGGEAAEAVVEECLRRFPGDPEVLYRLADVLIELEDDDRALDLLEEGVSMCGEEVRDLAVRARLFRTIDRIDGREVIEGELQAIPSREIGVPRRSERVGRNDPCPCGSGRKAKKCCGTRPTAPRHRAEALVRILLELRQWAGREENRPRIAEAFEDYWGHPMQGSLDEALERLETAELGACFLDYAFFDWPTRESLRETWVAQRKDALDAEQEAVLKELRLSIVSLYRVVAAAPGAGFLVRDLVMGNRCFVRDAEASRQVGPGDLLAARVVETEAGNLLAPGVLLFEPSALTELFASLGRLRDVGHQELWERGGWPWLLKCFPNCFVAAHARVRRRGQPRLVTAEGDPLVFCEARYEIEDAEVARSNLDDCPELEAQEKGRWTWLEPDGAERRRILGTVRLEGAELVLEVASEERGERGEELLERVLGQDLSPVARQQSTAEEARWLHQFSPRDPGQGETGEELPPEIASEIIGRYLEEHYSDWPDTSLPAFGGRSAREAVRSSEGRALVAKVLAEMEEAEARCSRPGGYRYDFSWIWEDLGLER